MCGIFGGLAGDENQDGWQVCQRVVHHDVDAGVAAGVLQGADTGDDLTISAPGMKDPTEPAGGAALLPYSDPSRLMTPAQAHGLSLIREGILHGAPDRLHGGGHLIWIFWDDLSYEKSRDSDT